jgi:hypothetical protein
MKMLDPVSVLMRKRRRLVRRQFVQKVISQLLNFTFYLNDHNLGSEFDMAFGWQ